MSSTAVEKIGVIINGATGRMGTNQHLIRSIMSIIRQGGVKIDDERTVMPDPILVGRNPAKLEALAARSGEERWTTDLDEALADPLGIRGRHDPRPAASAH